ncbi:homeodomain-like protein, partial [Tanacetum coccineum]
MGYIHGINDAIKVTLFDVISLIPRLIASEALRSIQELADHSQKWHNEECKNTPSPFSVIVEKLKALNHEMDEIRVVVRKINTNNRMRSLHEEIKSIRTSEISYDEFSPKSNVHSPNLKDTFKHYLKESCKRQDVLNEWMKKFMINTEMNFKDNDSSIKRLEENINHLVQLISTHNLANKECTTKPASEKPTLKVETFAEKVKRHIPNENSEGETIYNTSVNIEYIQQKLVSHEIEIEEVSMVKLNVRCSVVLQNELQPKEKYPRSFILPYAIGTTTLSNALADLGASISIMPFSLFKRLGLGNPRQINMVIEMADRSMQSPMEIVKNVLVKINKFIFPVDFIILDIIEDNKVPIILGRPMLATAHARIDVFGKKISLEVGTKQITFDINKKESPAVISPVYVINSFSEINELYEPKDLEELLLSNDDLYFFSNDNDLLPNLESHDNILLSPTGSARFNNDSSEIFCNPNSNSSISMDDFVKMDDVWDNLDYMDLTYKGTKSPVKPEFLSSSNRIHLHSPYNLQITCKIGSHQFLIDFIIFENINEFVEEGLTEVLFGQPFKEHMGIIDDKVNGILWFKIEDDKTIFNMPRAKKDLVPALRRQLSRLTRPIVTFIIPNTTAATTTTTAVTRLMAKGLVIQEHEQASTPITSSKDKGKGIMVEKPLKMKKKDQVLFDEQEAIRLQAQFDEEESIAREKEEVTVALIEEWNDIQAKIEANQLLAERLQAREQEELTIEEKSKLFRQLLEKGGSTLQLREQKKGEINHPQKLN